VGRAPTGRHRSRLFPLGRSPTGLARARRSERTSGVTSRVYLRGAERADPLRAVRDLLNRCEWTDLVPPGGSVVIKPNLCTDRPDMIHCANTSLSVLRAVCSVIRERTANVTI